MAKIWGWSCWFVVLPKRLASITAATQWIYGNSTNIQTTLPSKAVKVYKYLFQPIDLWKHCQYSLPPQAVCIGFSAEVRANNDQNKHTACHPLPSSLHLQLMLLQFNHFSWRKYLLNFFLLPSKNQKPFLPVIGLMWKILVCNVNLFSAQLSKSHVLQLHYCSTWWICSAGCSSSAGSDTIEV